MDDKGEGELLRRAILSFASARFEGLASKLIKEIEAYPSCGMLSDDEDAQNLWDDYCYDQQNGPTPFLEFAWSDVFAPHLDDLIGTLDRTEATLLSLASCWSQGEDACDLLGDPPTGIHPAGIAAEIMEVVNQSALNRGWREDGEDEDGDIVDDDEDADWDFSSHQQFANPGAYLDHLADALCSLLAESTDDERRSIMDDFRRSVGQLEIDDISLPHTTSDEDEIRTILNEGNWQAMNWAKECLALQTACAVDPDDAITVFDRLFRPTSPCCRVRDD